MAGVVKTPIIAIDTVNDFATIKVDNINVGVSGFIVHGLSKDNSTILKDAEVVSYNKVSKTATLKLSDFVQLKHDALPSGNWGVVVGDTAILAFGYSRALLIAPNEEVYYRVTRATSQVQWLHPDIFATLLSFKGHPTPQKEDFTAMSNETAVGLIFFYLNQNIFTVDAKSLKVINISEAKLKQDSLNLPFYTRVEEIDSGWWGSGTGDLDEYEPYYFELLIENNPENTVLQNLYSQFQSKR